MIMTVSRPENSKSITDPEVFVGFFRDNHYAEALDYVRTLPESARARLAVFFYQRRHLRSIGLDIAQTCSRGTLAEMAGGAGDVIYKQSRDPTMTMQAGQFSDDRHGRHKKISLAGA